MLSKPNKGLACYNEWFISAIKSSKIEGEVQEKKLLQHCLSCCSQVKSLIDSNEAYPNMKYEEFRLNSTILLLLACPTVRSCPQIASLEDLIPLIKSVPVIEDEKLFVVLKGLKNYRYLRGVLPWLPATVLTQLLSQFLKQSKSTTPLVLAISFEIIFALTHSLQFEKEVGNTLEDCLEAYTAFLKSIEVGFDSEQNCKLRAYHFLYIIESLYLLVCLMCKKEIEAGCTISLGITIMKLRSNINKETSSIFDSVIHKGTYNLLSICSEVVQLIDSDIWISWHDIKSPTFGLSFASGMQKETDDDSKSIQVQISHTVFRIVKLLEQLVEYENPLNLASYKQLQAVFGHFSADPDYDPDVDLTTSQLIDAIQDIDDARVKKLITFLLERENLFQSEDGLKCVQQFGGVMPKSIIIPFIKKVIDKLVCRDNILEGWKKVAIELCRNLPAENLLHIIKEKLNNGKLDCLKTSEFDLDVIQIFNQLSDHSDNNCYDSFVWLCLQSGVDVVKSSVDMAISLPGLAPVIAQQLRTVHFICRVKDEEDKGLSLIIRLLIDKLDNLSLESEREFLSLVLKLLEKPQYPDEEEEERPESEMPIDVSEMLEEIIYLRLNWQKESNSSLLLPLEILKSIAESYPATVLTSEARLSSLIVSLALIFHNCCTLTTANVVLNLSIRRLVWFILRRLRELILEEEQKYAKEISLAKVVLTQYDLHPRCLNLLFPLINSTGYADLSFVDQVSTLIAGNWDPQKSDCAIPNCNRTEWIWIMYLVLPNCDEEEWITSIRLTHAYLCASVGGCSNSAIGMVMATLRLFREVLLLLCESVSRLAKEGSNRKLTPLPHCFKCFSLSAMNFVREHLKEDGKKFSTVGTIFRWWCVSQRAFDCDPDLPCLFLIPLCNALTDFVRAKDVIIKVSKGCRPPSSSSDTASSRSLTNGDDGRTSEYGSSINGSDVDSVNGSDTNHLNGSDSTNGVGVKDAVANSHPKHELLTKEVFDQILSNLVSAFLTSVPPSQVASTIAGKLKAFCELV